jgi:predicted acetyltransferase
VTVRALEEKDIEQVWRLNQLAFGYRSDAPPDDIGASYGIETPDARIVASARIRSYEQWWGGRAVPMGGIAAVAVHPDARGQGEASRLMRHLLPVMREAGQPISVLFPTGVGVYRPVGWEVVGSLDDTRIPTRDLRPSGSADDVTVRTARVDDVPAIRELYVGLGVNGLLTREGPEFPAGADAVLEHDVVAVAEDAAGDAVGYTSYARGTGYREGSELRVWELVHRTGPGAAALLRSLASWSTVASTVLWRGPTTELARQLAVPVPPPVRQQPWMLRIVDAPAAIAARGFPPQVTADAAFVLDDPDLPAHCAGWRLQVADGSGSLEQVAAGAALPRLHVRGLALLYAGAADGGALVRAGLLDRPVDGLDAAFAGQAPRILDYF